MQRFGLSPTTIWPCLSEPETDCWDGDFGPFFGALTRAIFLPLPLLVCAGFLISLTMGDRMRKQANDKRMRSARAPGVVEDHPALFIYSSTHIHYYLDSLYFDSNTAVF